MVLRDGAKRGPWLGCSNVSHLPGDEDNRQTDRCRSQTGRSAAIPLLNEESAKSREMIAKVLGDNPAAVGTR